MGTLQPIASEKIVTDDLRTRNVREGMFKKFQNGRMLCMSPFETDFYFDWTNLRGSGFNIWLSFIYRCHKWGFRAKKLDEYIEVTPTYEYYKMTIEEKHKLEGIIKQGLASAAQAVSDYDLMAHDVRRYEEIIDYFKRSKDTGDDHILRSLFLDRVDAYTGEGYSMVTMAKRWPTIITDFIRMKSEWTEGSASPEEQVKKIRESLDVSMAEATVLRSKDILFKEWQKLFFPVVKDRYARVKAIADARKESIDRYKEWIRPALVRFQMMREETNKDPKRHIDNMFLTPGLGIAQTNQGARVWMWKPLNPQEFRRPEIIREKNDYVVYPFDDIAKEWMEKINTRYKLVDKYRLTEHDIEKRLEGYAHEPHNYPSTPESDLDPAAMYYSFFDVEFFFGAHKTPPPKGAELDNPQFKVTGWIMSANVLLIHLMELWAKENEMEMIVDTLIGGREREEAIRKDVEKMFEPPKKPTKNPIKRAKEGWQHTKHKLEPVSKAGRFVGKGVDGFVHLYVRRGPYDPVISERVTKTMARELREEYQRIINFLMWKANCDYRLDLYGSVNKN